MAIQGYSPGQTGGLGDMCGNRVEAAKVHLLNGRLVLFPQHPAHCEGFIFSFLLRWPHSETSFSLYRKEARLKDGPAKVGCIETTTDEEAGWMRITGRGRGVSCHTAVMSEVLL